MEDANQTTASRLTISVDGVEVGGVHVSEDQGETWTERRDGVHDDVHHVLILNPDEYVASCGDGLYRTSNAGQSWTRLNTVLDHRYFREASAHGSRLYAATSPQKSESPPNSGPISGSSRLLTTESASIRTRPIGSSRSSSASTTTTSTREPVSGSR